MLLDGAICPLSDNKFHCVLSMTSLDNVQIVSFSDRPPPLRVGWLQREDGWWWRKPHRRGVDCESRPC